MDDHKKLTAEEIRVEIDKLEEKITTLKKKTVKTDKVLQKLDEEADELRELLRGVDFEKSRIFKRLTKRIAELEANLENQNLQE
jgi:predicted RNase H-like nuclease (RuvC/YqgF family)